MEPSYAETRIGQVKTQNQRDPHIEIKKIFVVQGIEDFDCRIRRQGEEPGASDRHHPSHKGDDDG